MSKALDLFVIRLNIFMKEKNWEQPKLAEVSKIKQPQLSRYITKVNYPNLKTIEKIAEALGKPVSDFFSEDIVISSSEEKNDERELVRLWRSTTRIKRRHVMTILRENHASSGQQEKC